MYISFWNNNKRMGNNYDFDITNSRDQPCIFQLVTSTDQALSMFSVMNPIFFSWQLSQFETAK